MQKDTKKLLAVLLLMGTAGMIQSMEVEQEVVAPMERESNELNVVRDKVFKEIITLKNCIECLLQREKNDTIMLDEFIEKAIAIEKHRKVFKSNLVVKFQPLADHFQKDVASSFRKLYLNVLRQYNNVLSVVVEKVRTRSEAKEVLWKYYLSLCHLHNRLLDAGMDFFTLTAEAESNYYLNIIKQATV